MEGMMIVKCVIGLLLVATQWNDVHASLQTELAAVKEAMNAALSTIDASVVSSEEQCPICTKGGKGKGKALGHAKSEAQCVQNSLGTLQKEIQGFLESMTTLQDKADDTCPCRVNPTVPEGGDPGFIVYSQGTKKLYLIDTAGTLLAQTEITSPVRGMYHDPFSQRIFAFIQLFGVHSYDMNLQDDLAINNTSGSIGVLTDVMEGDPFKKELYLNVVVPAGIWKVGMDGTGLTQLVTSDDAIYAAGSRINTCNGMLYWTDMVAKEIKTVNVEGEPIVTTLSSTPEFPRALDVDFNTGVVYWCGISGSVYVVDFESGNNTQIYSEGSGVCNALRVSNSHIYMSRTGDSGIRKLALDGTFITMLFDGWFTSIMPTFFNLM